MTMRNRIRPGIPFELCHARARTRTPFVYGAPNPITADLLAHPL